MIGKNIDAPRIYEEGNRMNIFLNYWADIKKEDGRIMLSHTMIEQGSDIKQRSDGFGTFAFTVKA